MATSDYGSFAAIALTVLAATCVVAVAMAREAMGVRALIRRRHAERARAERMRAELWQRPSAPAQRRAGPRVLCAIDSSRAMPQAFDRALALSTRLGARLIVTHAPAGRWPHNWRAAERATAVSTIRKAAESRGVPVRIRRQAGDPATVVLLHARAHAPDFIVLGAHQPRGWRRALFTSVADRVADAARAPVVLVPPVPPASDRVRSVLCAVDLSPASRATLAEAADLAAALGARLTVLHVVPQSAHRGGLPGVSEFARSLRQRALERIEALVDGAGTEAHVRVTATTGSIHDAIVRVAVDEQADVIVAGPSRRSRMRRRLLGSTPINVSRRAPCPVVLIPPDSVDERLHGWGSAARRKAA